MYTLECEMLVALPVDEVFRVFEDPYNLARITPPWLNFRVTSPGRVQMRKGAEITYRIAWLGIPIHWKTRITGYDPPDRFVDEQASGPYVLWRHQHQFRSVPGGTEIKDRVDYILPFGFLGRVAHRVMVRRQLEQIFDYRQKALATIFSESRSGMEPLTMAK